MTSPRDANDSAALILWHRKWIVLGTLIAFMAVTALATFLMPNVYSSSAKLLVVQSSDTQGFDAVQAAQVTARTYSNLLKSEDLASQVARRIGGSESGNDLLKSVSVEPVAETQIVEITAEASSPRRAQDIADAYVAVVQVYARTRLAPTTKATVVPASAAPLPTSPARPRPKLYLFVGALLGLALGVALAFGRDRLDLRVRTVEDIESAFDAPVVARVPELRRGDAASEFAFDEAFRRMRTNLVLSHDHQGSLGTLAFVSADPGEGKTTCAYALASVSATSGLTVILVDADVRRPAVVRPTGISGEIGLSDYLLGNCTLDQALERTEVPELSVMSGGSTVTSLANLLASRGPSRSIAGLRDAADLVIVDCPPLNAGADAAAIAGHVDGVVVVVDRKTMRHTTIQETVRQLEAVRADLIGIVVNRDSEGASLANYGYQADPPAPKSARGGGA